VAWIEVIVASVSKSLGVVILVKQGAGLGLGDQRGSGGSTELANTPYIE